MKKTDLMIHFLQSEHEQEILSLGERDHKGPGLFKSL